MSESPGWIIHRYNTLTSTMDRAALLARVGGRERSAVVSDEQTAGRGRAGRTWHSPPGLALYCTLLVRPEIAPERLPLLSLVSGIAVAEAIEQLAAVPVQLKWPNDIRLGHQSTAWKVGGILLGSSLIGTTTEYVLIGIGVNVSGGSSELPLGATSLQDATGIQITPDDLLEMLLPAFDRAYSGYLASRGRPSLDGWRARAALLGEHVVVEDGTQPATGRFVDIDDDGALLLERSDGSLRRIMAGDLVRGPRPTPQAGG